MENKIVLKNGSVIVLPERKLPRRHKKQFIKKHDRKAYHDRFPNHPTFLGSDWGNRLYWFKGPKKVWVTSIEGYVQNQNNLWSLFPR